MTLESSSKKLFELRVVDLKDELEKRKLDCSGVKAVLVKKLEKALKDEGENPDTYKFCFSPTSSGCRKIDAVGPSDDDCGMNGDDKSDDEKPESDDDTVKPAVVEEEDATANEPSDDEAMKQDCEEEPVMNELSDEMKKDEKSDDENPVSDDEARKQVVEEEPAANELSDDEQQAAEAREEIIHEKQANDEDSKVSDDENPTPEEEKRSEDIKKEIEGNRNEEEEAQLSDDQMEDSEEKKEDTQEDKEKEISDSDNLHENTDRAKDITTAQEDQPIEKKDSDQTEGPTETRDNEPLPSGIDDKTTPKKLRPRITAPTDDGNCTKTPILKKDITLPPAKPKDEEFVVPEKEADIYDKEKFIVKDDTMGDSEDAVMDFEEDINNMDNEDSINLTIGEDDAKFMTEEAGLDNEDKDASEQRRADKKKGSTLQLDGDKLLTRCVTNNTFLRYFPSFSTTHPRQAGTFLCGAYSRVILWDFTALDWTRAHCLDVGTVMWNWMSDLISNGPDCIPLHYPELFLDVSEP